MYSRMKKQRTSWSKNDPHPMPFFVRQLSQTRKDDRNTVVEAGAKFMNKLETKRLQTICCWTLVYCLTFYKRKSYNLLSYEHELRTQYTGKFPANCKNLPKICKLEHTVD